MLDVLETFGHVGDTATCNGSADDGGYTAEYKEPSISLLWFYAE